MKLRNLLLTVAALALTAFSAVAQNVYSGPRFTAAFNGPVSTSTFTNPTNSNTSYTANDGVISTEITVRKVDHEIPVDFGSANFYRGNECSNGTLAAYTNNAYYQGRPFAYAACTFTSNGTDYITMERIIIVDSTTVIFIGMTVPVTVANQSPTKDSDGGNTAFLGWVNFERSLTIQ